MSDSRTAEEKAIGEAYQRAEERWQAYRRQTGDHTDGGMLEGSPEKDAIRKLWEAFFALFEPFKSAHVAPLGLRWGIASDPYRPGLYVPIGEARYWAFQTGFENVAAGI